MSSMCRWIVEQANAWQFLMVKQGPLVDGDLIFARACAMNRPGREMLLGLVVKRNIANLNQSGGIGINASLACYS
jgi:hypothetical protein